MKNDREMFELAAKAAGIEDYKWSDEYRCMIKPTGIPADGDFSEAVYTWNPRYDDGDSRRLQVKLQIYLEFEPNGFHDHVSALGFVPNTSDAKYVAILLGYKPCEAARLAVLHVAAEIGKAMP